MAKSRSVFLCFLAPQFASLLIVSAAALVVVSSAPSPFLPPLLRFNNGSVVDTAEQWIGGRRGEVAALVQEVITGSIPSGSIPPLIRSRTINTTRLVGGNSTFVELTFDTAPASSKAADELSFDVEVLQPENTGAKLPVFLTQWNHREWGLVGFSRGYLSVIYPGADTRDIAPAFQEAYKTRGATMALIIARAFVASRTLDYILTLPFVDKDKVCITGHSRNGK